MTKRQWLTCCVALIALAAPARGGVALPSIFGDHLVLQREQEVPIWGRAGARDAVTVTFADQVRIVNADDSGAWRVTLEPMPASAEPRKLRVASGGQTITIRDVLVGEVWLCSGQSNMAWPVAMSHEAKRHIKAAGRPTLRLARFADGSRRRRRMMCPSSGRRARRTTSARSARWHISSASTSSAS